VRLYGSGIAADIFLLLFLYLLSKSTGTFWQQTVNDGDNEQRGKGPGADRETARPRGAFLLRAFADSESHGHHAEDSCQGGMSNGTDG